MWVASGAMGRWWSSDHHFGHANIIGYCARPFGDVDAMNNAMVDRWNDVVGDGDEVWILGDLVMGQLSVNLSEHVWLLKGRKILVPGNHDTCWQHRNKGPHKLAAYYDLGGIARIVDDPQPVVLAGERVQINHFPYALASRYDAKFMSHRPRDDGGWLLHGHIHEKWRQNGRQINVGVDAWDFGPVSDDTISELIRGGPANVACPAYTPADA